MKKVIDRLITYIYDKAFIKYILSYLVILSISAFLFFLVYNKYFLSLYSQEIVAQKRNNLERMATDLDNQIWEFFSITGQLSKQEVMQKKYIYNNTNAYVNIQKILKGIAATHSSFNQIAFYSTASPDILYTNLGDYNTSFYKHYQMFDNEEWQSVDEILPFIQSATWLFPQNSYWPSYDTGTLTLDYIMPVPDMDEGYVIFSISENILDSLVYSQDIQSVIFDKNYIQLYPFYSVKNLDVSKIKLYIEEGSDKPVEIEEQSCLLCATSGKNGFIIAQIIPEHIMYHDVSNVQKMFFLAFLSLFLLGGAASYIMSTLNYKPIRRLNKLISEKGLDIPNNLYGTDAVSFAIKKLDNQYKILECNRLREKILLKLMHNKNSSTDAFAEECKHAGINFTEPIMRVALIFINSHNTLEKNIDVIELVKTMMYDTYEVNGAEYLQNNCYLFTIGYNCENQNKLSKRLIHVASQLSVYTGSDIKITVGSACEQINWLSKSYMQSMWLSKNSTASDIVLFYDDNCTLSVPFVYPKIDIDALYSAIINGSTDKIIYITDILIDIVKENLHNNFVSIFLCFNIINIFLCSIDKLNISTSNAIDTYNHYFNLYELTDTNSFIDVIFNLRDDTLNLINKNSDLFQSHHIISQIIDYINKNYKNEDLCVNFIAEVFNMSVSNLSHQFKAQTGINISDFITDKKIALSKELLQNSQLTVGDIAIRLGYSQTSSFIRRFKKCVKCTPNEYRLIYQNNQQ